jgi:hypothetical protein
MYGCESHFSSHCLHSLLEHNTDFSALELQSSIINNRDLLFLLVARRSRHRGGTRYFSRGIDQDGYTSNFNETEQIVLLDPLSPNGEPSARGRVDGRERLSFVQTRGSVPVFWAEVNNLRYKPDLQIMEVPETVSLCSANLGGGGLYVPPSSGPYNEIIANSSVDIGTESPSSFSN